MNSLINQPTYDYDETINVFLSDSEEVSSVTKR